MDYAEYLRELRRLRPARPAAGRGPADRLGAAPADRLGPSGLDENLIVLERTGSTNRLARALADEYEREAQDLPALVLLAFEQTGGRGRGDRTWSSPAGLGVYATLVFRVEEPEALATLPLLAGVGLCRALDAYLPGRVGLKWPNDLVVAGRKLGGILIETRLRPGEPATAILGFGVNQGQGAGDLPVLETGAATSLRLEGAEAALPELTWGLVAGVERELQRLGDFPYAVAAYRERSVHRQGERLVCRAGEERVAGIFRGFDERGLLLLDVAGPAGERRLHLAAGEVVEAVETRGVRNVD